MIQILEVDLQKRQLDIKSMELENMFSDLARLFQHQESYLDSCLSEYFYLYNSRIIGIFKFQGNGEKRKKGQLFFLWTIYTIWNLESEVHIVILLDIHINISVTSNALYNYQTLTK